MKKKRTKKNKLMRNVAKVTRKNTVENQTKKQSQATKFDSAWKTLVRKMWKQLIQRALPHLYAEMDLDRPPEFLSQELHDPLQDAKEINYPKYVDDLLKVYLRDGALLKVYTKNLGEKIVYLHLEVQGEGGREAINPRMLLYAALILSHYYALPEALAILTAPRPLDERDDLGDCRIQTGNTCMTYHYNVLELYKLDDDELLNSGSPIDIAFYAAKIAGTKPQEIQKYTYLKTLTRVLAQKGWSETERMEIYRFIARVIDLKDAELEKRYRDEVKTEEETREMESFIEKYFKDEGRDEGREESARLAESYMQDKGFAPDVIDGLKAAILAGTAVPA